MHLLFRLAFASTRLARRAPPVSPGMNGLYTGCSENRRVRDSPTRQGFRLPSSVVCCWCQQPRFALLHFHNPTTNRVPVQPPTDNPTGMNWNLNFTGPGGFRRRSVEPPTSGG